eukprot:scaffold301845_cov27-Tisochrysis_lutea.AAC.2
MRGLSSSLRGALLFLPLSFLPASLSSDAHSPHPHSGKLSPYLLGPPTLLLSASDEESLSCGSTVVRALLTPQPPSADERREGGTRRLLMVRDVAAPKSVVMARINDFEAYPRMVKG